MNRSSYLKKIQRQQIEIKYNSCDPYSCLLLVKQVKAESHPRQRESRIQQSAETTKPIKKKYPTYSRLYTGLGFVIVHETE